jgi:hypothetical protein
MKLTDLENQLLEWFSDNPRAEGKKETAEMIRVGKVTVLPAPLFHFDRIF